MVDFPYFVKEQERPVAVLGADQLQWALQGQKTNRGYCVLSQDRLYWGGQHFFQNYMGRWHYNGKNSSEEIANITSIHYKRRMDPTRTWRVAMILTVAVLLFSLLGTLICENRTRFNQGFFILITLIMSIMMSMMTLFRARRNVMLDIEFGCEILSLRTSWYKKEELDVFYNQLIDCTSMAHAADNLLKDMDLQKTYGGKKILTEFGGQYREQYLKDRKAVHGFCTVTPGELHFGGAYSINVFPGLWCQARKIRQIPICDLYRIRYGVVRSPLRVIFIYLLILVLVMMSVTQGRNIGSQVVFTFTLSMLPVCPIWAAAMFRERRLIIESYYGTYAFWTHQDRKEEIQRFQKILIQLMEMEKTAEKPQKAEIIRQEDSAVQTIGTEVDTGLLQEKAALLKQYNQLLQEGAINQAEFEKIKQEIFSKTI